MSESLTYIDDEMLAYNTYHGGHSRSNRRGRVRFPDGKLRTVTLGIPDTYFSIPVHATVKGHYVSGWVSFDDDTNEYIFNPSVRA